MRELPTLTPGSSRLKAVIFLSRQKTRSPGGSAVLLNRSSASVCKGRSLKPPLAVQKSRDPAPYGSTASVMMCSLMHNHICPASQGPSRQGGSSS